MEPDQLFAQGGHNKKDKNVLHEEMLFWLNETFFN